MAYADVRVRFLEIAEKKELKRYIRELRRLDRRRNPPSCAYRSLLEEMLTGPFTKRPSIPPWIAEYWSEEDVSDPQVSVLHDFDNIIVNADMARLGYFARSGEGQVIRSYLKKSFGRVTLATESSIYSICDEDAGLFCFPTESFEIVKSSVCQPPVRGNADALVRILERIDIMTHVDSMSVELVD